MSRSLRGVGAPTTDDASPVGRRRGDQNGGGDDTTPNEDDDANLSIKVRSHDPVGEYEFSVSKTVRVDVFRIDTYMSLSRFFPALVTLDEAL